MRRNRVIVLGLAVLLAGCSAEREEARVAALFDPAPTPVSFIACHGSNCRIRTPVALAPEEWQEIEAIFERSAASPQAERDDIAKAIALFEQFVGPKAGTSSDVGKNRSVADQSTQLDCIDESVNTSTYLRMLQDAELLQWHTVAGPAHRHFGLIDFHNTAVIIDRSTGEEWAVDSWFGPNGAPPAIIPLATWRAGWQPRTG